MANIPITEIVLLILFFVGAREFWFKMNVDMVKNSIYSAVYFSFWSLVIFLTFGQHLSELVAEFKLFPIILLIAIFGLSFISYYLLKHKFKTPLDLIKRYPSEKFLTLSYRYLFSKSFDILFQQIAVITVLTMLYQNGVSLFNITIGFALVFGFLHLRIVHKEGVIGWFYVIGSTLAGFVFPYLILEIDYGFIYTYIIHWFFYLLLGIAFWIYAERRVEA